MLSQTIQNAINDQIKNELYSGYLYLSMSAYFECHNLTGTAKWMRVQAKEEIGHAMKFFDYVNDRGGRVLLAAIDQPPTDWSSPLEAWQTTLEHERKVTGLIYNLNKLAREENDYATEALLQWFITEQVEEEKNASQIVEQVRMGGDRGTSLLFLDRHLGKRSGE